MCKWHMRLGGEPKKVKPFLKNSFLKDFRRRNCGGRCVRCAPEFADVARFVVEGEKRYWLRIAIDRFDGTIVGLQLEEVTE